MDRENRERAVRLLEEKRGGGKATYSDIALETGYSIRQLIRLSGRLAEEKRRGRPGARQQRL